MNEAKIHTNHYAIWLTKALHYEYEYRLMKTGGICTHNFKKLFFELTRQGVEVKPSAPKPNS